MVADAGLKNLKTLSNIRLIVLITELAGLQLASWWSGVKLLWLPVLIVFAAMAALILYTRWRCRRDGSVSPVELFLHLLTDVLLQTLLLFWTGGYTNPFISVYLVSVTIGASLLPQRFSWVLTLLAVGCYTLLQGWYRPLTDMMHGHGMHEGMMPVVSLHLAGMWLTFTISACLITGFVASMATVVRRHRAEIAASREYQLRNERILSVAMTAAGAAHELSTPLSTMSVLLKDMQQAQPESEELREDLALLRSQVEVCKERLKTIVATSQSQESTVTPARQFIEQVLDEWQLLRPGITLNLDCEPDFSLCMAADQGLAMALINLLNNAADVSPEQVELALFCRKQQIVIRISDRGEGVLPEIASRLGYTTVSTKEDGSGLGLQLSVATVERLRGVVRLYPRKGGGTMTEVSLPQVAADD